ncbi:MAG: TIR domain-containing protein [Paracoccaceae bacterium]
MADVFHDGIEALMARVAASGIIGEWTEEAGGTKHVFRSRERGVLNYWPNKGTVQYQGKPEAQAPLKAVLAGDAPAAAVPKAAAAAKDERTKIFVVHGHDRHTLDQLELILRRLGLDPFILQNNDGGGNTIIEALEQQIYKEAAFGIVLMTPDDYGYAKAKGDEATQPRARQNVILEMGMVLASLGRDRMAILKKGALEHPSDVDGVLRLDFNDEVREVAVRLATRMKKAGIEIDDALIAGCGV